MCSHKLVFSSNGRSIDFVSARVGPLVLDESDFVDECDWFDNASLWGFALDSSLAYNVQDKAKTMTTVELTKCIAH